MENLTNLSTDSRKLYAQSLKVCFLGRWGAKRVRNIQPVVKYIARYTETHLSLSTKFRAFTEYGNANALSISVIYGMTSRIDRVRLHIN